jgi:hypothetical protein
MGSRHRPSSTQPRSVGARIERWRATRTKRSPMPEPLWDAAVELAQAEGIYPIARALAVNYQTLKCRVAMASNGNSGTPAGFVELTPMPANGSVSRGELVLELSSGDGATLTIRLPSERELDVERLAEAFLRRGRR